MTTRSIAIALILLAVHPVLSRSESSQSLTQAASGRAKAEPDCPSHDFVTFFRAFSVRADLQRTFTSFPFEYGVLNMDGTPENPEPQFLTRTLNRYEQIPLHRPETDLIFPSAAELQKYGLEIHVTTIIVTRFLKTPDPEDVVTKPNEATATVFLPDSGFRVHYRFRRTARCWFLIGLSDRST